jgi:hypothetical protein
MQYQPANRISMRQHPELTEKWLQTIISDDPSILGLGDLVVRDLERRQPRAGRLDVLLSNPETLTRYEVEIQLGATDESHIIRTIEYWDLERRRLPQYDHVAVIVAEEITGRFLNVISLFNGSIPLIAIQIQAVEVQGTVSLVAARVVDVVELATEEEDEGGGVTDRSYWEERGSPLSLGLADEMLGLIREKTDARLDLKYNKGYVGLARDGIAGNFILFWPKKQHLIAAFKIPESDELTSQLTEKGIDLMGYGRGGRYRVRITGADLAERREMLGRLVEMAAESYGK